MGKFATISKFGGVVELVSWPTRGGDEDVVLEKIPHFEATAEELLTATSGLTLIEPSCRPISWLNPTRAIFDIQPTKDTTNVPQKHPIGTASSPDLHSKSISLIALFPGTPPRTDTIPQDAKLQWRARDNRKGSAVQTFPPLDRI